MATGQDDAVPVVNWEQHKMIETLDRKKKGMSEQFSKFQKLNMLTAELVKTGRRRGRCRHIREYIIYSKKGKRSTVYQQVEL